MTITKKTPSKDWYTKWDDERELKNAYAEVMREQYKNGVNQDEVEK